MDKEEADHCGQNSDGEISHLSINLDVPRENAETYLRSISPEIKEFHGRSRVDLNSDDRGLRFDVKSEDLHALRASLNTYLRWIVMCEDLTR